MRGSWPLLPPVASRLLLLAPVASRLLPLLAFTFIPQRSVTLAVLAVLGVTQVCVGSRYWGGGAVKICVRELASFRRSVLQLSAITSTLLLAAPHRQQRHQQPTAQRTAR